MAQRFDANANPLPPEPSKPRDVVRVMALFAVVVTVFGWMLFMLVTAPPMPVSVSPPPSVTPSSEKPGFSTPLAVAVQVMFPSELVLVTHTPQPRTSPVTRTPTVVCGPWVKQGEVCEMEKAPRPTPTPLSTCPVLPEEECIWTGQAMGTPVRIPSDATAMAGNGSNS